MESVSVTEAKNRLSALLDRVRAGETILILDRGRPVATLEPAVAIEDDARLERLYRAGVVRPAKRRPSLAVLAEAPPQASASVVEALLEERREGR